MTLRELRDDLRDAISNLRASRDKYRARPDWATRASRERAQVLRGVIVGPLAETTRMSAPWQIVETFGGDRSYESPVLTFDGVVTIYLNPEDAEGAALTLRVASNLREAASIHLTIEEADALACWLRQAIDDLDEAGA